MVPARRLAEGADLMLTYGRHADEAEHVADQVRKPGRRAEVMQADFADPTARPGSSPRPANTGVTIDAITPALTAGTRMLPLAPDDRVPPRREVLELRALVRPFPRGHQHSAQDRT